MKIMPKCLLAKQKTFGLLRVRSKEELLKTVNNTTITKTVHLVSAALRLGT